MELLHKMVPLAETSPSILLGVLRLIFETESLLITVRHIIVFSNSCLITQDTVTLNLMVNVCGFMGKFFTSTRLIFLGGKPKADLAVWIFLQNLPDGVRFNNKGTSPFPFDLGFKGGQEVTPLSMWYRMKVLIPIPNITLYQRWKATPISYTYFIFSKLLVPDPPFFLMALLKFLARRR